MCRLLKKSYMLSPVQPLRLKLPFQSFIQFKYSIGNNSISFQESKKLFISLYKSWAHSEPAILALVFYAGCYSHGLKLVQEISKHEMTVDFLMGIDRFIQIMESPIFSCKFFNVNLLQSVLYDIENHSGHDSPLLVYRASKQGKKNLRLI